MTKLQFDDITAGDTSNMPLREMRVQYLNFMHIFQEEINDLNEFSRITIFDMNKFW